ncbi:MULTISPECIES: hypothetical protein [unclassified Bradyrhizobium]|nr:MULTISPECIES: hypothetical protein [unclassified Bradyrhizobium]
MTDVSKIKEHMDVISSDRKMVDVHLNKAGADITSHWQHAQS